MIPFVRERDHSSHSPDVGKVVQTRDMWRPFAHVQGGEDEALGSGWSWGWEERATLTNSESSGLSPCRRKESIYSWRTFLPGLLQVGRNGSVLWKEHCPKIRELLLDSEFPTHHGYPKPEVRSAPCSLSRSPRYLVRYLGHPLHLWYVNIYSGIFLSTQGYLGVLTKQPWISDFLPDLDPLEGDTGPTTYSKFPQTYSLYKHKFRFFVIILPSIYGNTHHVATVP